MLTEANFHKLYIIYVYASIVSHLSFLTKIKYQINPFAQFQAQFQLNSTKKEKNRVHSFISKVILCRFGHISEVSRMC